MLNKPYSEACERNQGVILEKILPILSHVNSVFEIGSGTGQHAVYFAKHLPHLTWQTSDRDENHVGINAWINDAKLNNIHAPIKLDVLSDRFPEQNFDAAFSANTAHIMPWNAVEAMFSGVAKILADQGVFILYGPFNYGGQYTSESNQQFDYILKTRAKHQGIRDFETINQLAETHQLNLKNDFSMPANNKLLVWEKA